MQTIFGSFPRTLLKSGMGPLARYVNHQEIINRRLEQMYTLSDTRLAWPGEGHYSSRTQINSRGKTGPLFESPPRPLLQSVLQPLITYGTHQTISGRLEHVYLPSDLRLDWPGEGPLFELNFE